MALMHIFPLPQVSSAVLQDFECVGGSCTAGMKVVVLTTGERLMQAYCPVHKRTHAADDYFMLRYLWFLVNRTGSNGYSPLMATHYHGKFYMEYDLIECGTCNLNFVDADHLQRHESTYHARPDR